MAYLHTMLPIVLVTTISLAIAAPSTDKMNKQDSCHLPLGMEHGHIKDEDITASSAFDHKSVGPQNARLGKDIYGGAWCPKEVIEPGVREWIEIDLHREYRITRTATQGRYGGGQGQEYAEAFILEYWRPSIGKWMTYRNHSGHSVMKGNSNTYVANINELTPSIVASKVRFVPYSQHPRTVCMRVEVFGCRYEGPLVSYSAPPGDEFSPNFFLEDIFDGTENETNGFLTNGFGLLTDGLYGESVSLLDARSSVPSAPGWVGWANRDGKPPVTLTFEFKNVREFSEITLTSYGELQSGIQPFTQMLAFFSLDGKNYHPKYVKTVNRMNSSLLEGPANITQKLDGRLGKFVKIEIYFENKWMILSEIQFSSKESVRKDIPYKEFIEIPANAVNDNVDVGVDYEQNVEEEERVQLSDNPGQTMVTSSGSSETTNRKQTSTSSKQASNAETNQVYVGLVIGVLSVTVLLLIVTIIVMMRRNKQKIFNKHAMIFKSPISDHHRMRDLTPLNHSALPLPPGKMYGESDNEESNSIYHEPYRLVLQRNNYRNSSCGRLCEYEDLGLLASEQKGKFGSTPLFTLPPAPPTTSTNSSGTSQNSRTVGRFVGPTSYSCQEVKNGYAVPTQSTPMTIGSRHTARAMTPAHENFYAATDIVIQNTPVMHSPPQRKHSQLTQPRSTSPGGYIGENCLSADCLTTFLIPSQRVGLETVSDMVPCVPEIPRNKLRMVEKLGEGGFGMIHLCETIASEYGSTSCQSFNQSRKLVVVKSMWKGATKPERTAFTHLVKRLASLHHTNIAQVVAACTQDEPLCIVTEFSEYGDLYQFLRNHNTGHLHNNNNNITSDSSDSSKGHYSNATELALLHASSPNTSASSSSSTALSGSTLSYIATQIACGMEFLESLGFVHRDLSTRNCLIGVSYNVKISDSAIYRPIYSSDYHRVPESSDEDVLPLRWIPWEVYVMRLWSTKSDVWSFGVTLWEIFTQCSEKPLADLTDAQVVENLKHWFHSDGFHLLPTRPPLSTCSKEMFDLMAQCWSREPEERPRFAEIHQFLQNKCTGFLVD